MNGALAFVDTSDCTMMNIAEHYMASDVEWDPTGRYVVTSVSWWSHKVKLPWLGRDIDTDVVYLLKTHTEGIILPPHPSSCAGGQRVLVVDVSGPSSSEEQQRSLLSAALEAQTSLPAQWRPNQGKIKADFTFFTARGPRISNSHQVLPSVCVVVEPVMTDETTFLTPRMRAVLQLLIPNLI